MGVAKLAATSRALIVSRPLLSVWLTHLVSLLFALYLYARNNGGFVFVSKKLVFKFVVGLLKRVPASNKAIEKENQKVADKIRKSVIGDMTGQERFLELPENGWTKDKVMNQLQQWSEDDKAIWKSGKVSGCVYHGGDDLLSLAGEAQALFSLNNPLHPDVFRRGRKMEAEVVSMCVNLFRGGEGACGTLTSGGTESIIMACRAAKVFGQKMKGVVEGEVVAPVTVHAAFDKACEYFGMRLIKVDVHPVTREAQVKEMRKAVNSKTVLIVGSAPSYPNGTIDPITQLGVIARDFNIPLHVDCCLGSFLVAFARRLGYPIPDFDFSVPGVTSISCDTHKYGFSPKGTSVIMYSTGELRKCQYFVAPDWSGGIYASPTIAGSRPGSVSAATWAVMIHMGADGYTETCKNILDAAQLIEEGVEPLSQHIRVLGKRHLSVVSLTPSEGSGMNIYNVGDAMGKRGWNLNTLQHPASIHICVTQANCGMAREFVTDLKESVEEVHKFPERFKGGDAAIYGMAESLPDKDMVGDLTKVFVDALFEA